MSALPCTKCNGKGALFHKGFESLPDGDGKVTVYPDKNSTCYACGGSCTFEEVDGVVLDRLLALLTTTRGASKGKRVFKKSHPIKGNPYGKSVTRDERRAYYLWRMARFHGGIDVCMPMTAMSMVTGDPCIKVLDLIADKIAILQFGTARGAAMRWGNALGMLNGFERGLPAGAYAGGPVTDDFKPCFEAAELR